MMWNFKALLVLLLTFSAITAIASRDAGNGGDGCERRILEIQNDIESWILGDGHQFLELPSNISAKKYKDNMLAAIKENTVTCNDSKINIGKSEKTCKNFKDEEGQDTIQCNFSRFNYTIEEEQYRLVHHELAGISGFEVNSGNERSDYFLSNQLTSFLENKVVKRLAIKPKNTTSISSAKLCYNEIASKYYDFMTKRTCEYKNDKKRRAVINIVLEDSFNLSFDENGELRVSKRGNFEYIKDFILRGKCSLRRGGCDYSPIRTAKGWMYRNMACQGNLLDIFTREFSREIEKGNIDIINCGDILK